MKSVKRTRLTMSLNYLQCTKKQLDWMKLLSFPDVVIEKHSTKQYEELHEYLERLKSYAYHIETCGEERNSYSKTDHDATFMRLKRDYMGNDQLLPAYNLQAAICDEYIAVIDVKPYASDMECFVPLMENSIAHMVTIRNIRLLMPDTVLTIIIFIVKNTAWKNT